MSDLITVELVDLDLDSAAATKDEAILRLVSLAQTAGRVTDVELLLADVRAREEQMPTGLENGIGIPHARSKAVLAPTVVFGRSTHGIDFGASDGPATLVFLIAAPDDGNGDHLRVLAALARRLVHDSFRTSLRDAVDAAAVVEIFDREVTPR